MSEILFKLIDLQLDHLEKLANEIAEEYWTWRDIESEKRDVRERAQLNVRVRRRESTIEINWMKISFVMNKKKDKTHSWHPRSTSLAKGKNDRYPVTTLSKNAQEWEIEQSQKTEDKFVEIRRQIKVFNKIRWHASKMDKDLLFDASHLFNFDKGAN